MRDQGNHQVRPRFAPIAAEQGDRLRMHRADERVRQTQHCGAADGQSAPEQEIVDLLAPYSSELAHAVDWVQHIAEIHQSHLPWPILFLNQVAERDRRGAMASARVHTNQINARFTRWRPIRIIRTQVAACRTGSTFDRAPISGLDWITLRVPSWSSTSAVQFFTQSPSLR